MFAHAGWSVFLRRVAFASLLAALIGQGALVYGQIRQRDTNFTSNALDITTTSPLASVEEDNPLLDDQFIMSATGGVPPYSNWTVIGSAPTGLSLNASTGEWSGTPTTADLYSFAISVQDSTMASVTENFTWTIETAGSLPDPWVCTSIGAVSSPGTCDETAGEWEIVGVGLTYGTADAFTWAYQPVSGDNYISANIEDCTTTGIGAEECGVRVNQSLTAGSANLFCGFTDSTYGTLAEWRLTSGAATSSDVGPNITSGYARIQVYNGTPNCAVSTDGMSWTSIPISNPPTLTGTYYIGMPVNGNDFGLVTATISNVTVDVYIPPVTGTDFQGYRAHYQSIPGGGMDTLGGYSGEDEYCIVNTLTISGATPSWPDGGGTGDLEDCLEDAPASCAQYTGTQAACARWVFFAVSGRFTDPDGFLFISHPYLTIAGQTAPSCDEGSPADGTEAGSNCAAGAGGVLIYDTQVYSTAHDVVWQHIRIRRLPPGHQTNNGGWVVNIGNVNGHQATVHHTVLDHVSISWGSGDPEAMFGGAGAANSSILIVDSIIAEPFLPASLGHLFFAPTASCAVTVARTYYAHVWARNPWYMGPCKVLHYNNYNFDMGDPVFWGTVYTVTGIVDHFYSFGATQAAFVGNVIDPGPDSGAMAYSFGFSIHPNSLTAGISVYLQDNTGPGITGTSGANQYAGALFLAFAPEYVQSGNAGNTFTSTAPSFLADIQLISNTGNAVRDAVIGNGGAPVGNAGARPLDRDSVDARLVQDPLDSAPNNGTFNVDLSNYGGLPVIVERTRTVTLPGSPTADGDCGTMLVSGNPMARTVLQCWAAWNANYGADRLEVYQGTPE